MSGGTWSPDWLNTRSSKCAHLLQRLAKIGAWKVRARCCPQSISKRAVSCAPLVPASMCSLVKEVNEPSSKQTMSILWAISCAHVWRCVHACHSHMSCSQHLSRLLEDRWTIELRDIVNCPAMQGVGAAGIVLAHRTEPKS